MPTIVTIILSAIGLAPAIVGIVASGLVLHYADGQHYMLVLVIFALFVINIVVLALSELRRRRGI